MDPPGGGSGRGGDGRANRCPSANADVPVVLFDLPAKDGDPNGIATRAIANLSKLNPAPLAVKERVELIQPANYDQHLELLRSCDLVIEAIAERPDWKADLYQRITPTSTSGRFWRPIPPACRSTCWRSRCPKQPGPLLRDSFL
ncbi:MAG: hypothetical protein IPL99_29315 [Candidatus Competibacteraceae bacterium]|nr:hypothetical protein [Candidatus Competibacteraceae bacterium]